MHIYVYVCVWVCVCVHSEKGREGGREDGYGDQERNRKRETDQEEMHVEGKRERVRQTCVSGGKLIEGIAERNDNLSCISPSA